MLTTRARFGRAVRRLRMERGYSQERFADVIHTHRTFMGAVERGETNISLDNITKIAKGLDMSLAQLFAEVDEDVR